MPELLNTTYDSFLRIISGKTLICYGAGNMLDEMAETFPSLPDVCDEILIVDGAPEKQGKQRALFRREFHITDISLLNNINSADAVILITSAAIKEIFHVLQTYINTDMSVFSFLLMRMKHYEENMTYIGTENTLLGKREKEQIPRVIHYFWFGKHEMPDDYKRNMETWRLYCPDYELELWDENSCDLTECHYAREAYDAGRYGFVPDYFRLKVIYEQGGIYLDTDVKLLKPLDELLYLDGFAGFEDNDHVAFGVGFGAKPKLSILKEMYESYEKESFIKPDGNLNLIASPVYQTDQLKRHGLSCDGRMQIVGGMTILPMNYLTVQSPHTGKNYQNERSFSIHQYAASWRTEKERQYSDEAKELFETVKAV